MGRRRLLWHLAVPLFALVATALAVAGLYASNSLQSFYEARTRGHLQARATLVQALMRHEIGRVADVDLDLMVKRLGHEAGTRLTVVAPSGRVIAESDGDPASMDNHVGRPEILAAFETGNGEAIRHSRTLGTTVLYHARAVDIDGERVAVVRAALPLQAVTAALSGFRLRMALMAAVVALLAGGVGVALARRVAQPLEVLRDAAESFADGDLNHRIVVGGSSEVGDVAAAMNHMASTLKHSIGALEEERNEREALFAGMIEGVLAVDSAGSIMAVNRAGERLLDVHAEDVVGESIEAAVRNFELQAFVADALVASDSLERDLVIHREPPTHLQAHAGPVCDAAGQRIGVVVVLNDVTRLRRLEAVRREFVANVSHELRTPITSIKGFLETLLSGALDDRATAERFLGIAMRQADRLNSIIEDLLSLSQIQQTADSGDLPVQRAPVLPILRDAVAVCGPLASQRDVRIAVDCSADLEADVNSALLEQAVVNLVSNAAKYSPEGGEVVVTAADEEDSLRIDVVDRGPGIEAEHLSRLFERFYRVDKARSRKAGGTGLGLAIVKHIAQAHGGTASVTSQPGQGSVFSLTLPLETPTRS